MTKLKIKEFNNEVKTVDVNIIYTAKHVNDRKFYDSLNDVEFKDDTEILLISEERSQYGYSVLYLKDKENKIYEYDGFGHSGASSIVSYMLKDIEHRKNSINKRIEDLEERVINHAEEIEHYCDRLATLAQNNEKLSKLAHKANDERYESECQNARYKTALEEIRKEVQEDITCESRECGCDSYYECLECLKITILNIISEVQNE